MATKQQQQQQAESIAQLTSADGYAIQPGDTLYTSNHGTNGTYLKVFVVKPDHTGQHVPFNITWHVARALGVKPKDKNGSWMIHNPVYGMDRGFDIVYALSQKLFAGMDDAAIRTHNAHGGPIEAGSGDAGYLLNQRWL